MDTYRQAEGVNFSSFKHFLECPALYKWKLENPEPKTDAFLLGDLVHTIILEPEKLDDKFLFWDENERPDKKYTMAAKENKAWLNDLSKIAEQFNKYLVNYSKKNQAIRMVEAFATDPFAMNLHAEAERFEREVFWTRKGVKCKGKQDIYHKDYIADIKTTSADSPGEFIHKALYYYRYDLQAAMYTDDEPKEFYFVCIPKKVPHIPYVVAVSTETLDKARKQFHAGLERLKVCRETDNWEGYKMKIM